MIRKLKAAKEAVKDFWDYYIADAEYEWIDGTSIHPAVYWMVKLLPIITTIFAIVVMVMMMIRLHQ